MKKLIKGARFTPRNYSDEVEAKIYASVFVENASGYELLPIESEEEWKALQEAIVNLTKEQ